MSAPPFDGRPASDLIADRVLERVLARAPAAVGVGDRGEAPNGGVAPWTCRSSTRPRSAQPVKRSKTAAAALPASSRGTASIGPQQSCPPPPGNRIDRPAAVLPASSREPHRSDRPGAG